MSFNKENICLSENLLFIVVRLESSKSNGKSVGTGFLYNYERSLFLVTNKHVIKDAKEGHFTMTKASTDSGKWDPIIGQGVVFDFTEDEFIGHPDPNIDVAVANITQKINKAKEEGNAVYCYAVENDIIPTKEQIEKYIRPLEDIVFIGYPRGIWDYINLLPVIRKGITATPYYYDFLGENKFLVDASVFPGSSGSPVFIYYSGSYSDKKGNLYEGNMIFFLGILAQGFTRDVEGEIKVKSIPTMEVPVAISKQMIDLGIVFKASTIIEAVTYYVSMADGTESSWENKLPRA